MERTCLVTGASRGVGRGIATALAQCGFRVFATGRTIREASLPPEITCIPCDHTDDDQTDAAFRRIASEAGTLDLLVNNAWGGYEQMVEGGQFTWTLPFWEQPRHRWTSMMDTGVRAAYMCSAHAARIMAPNRRGLIVNISFWAAQRHMANVIYGVSKAAINKMTVDMAHELQPHSVTVVSLYPGLVRTEAVLAAAQGGFFDLSNSESPEFIGLVIAALARDPQLFQRSGQILVAAEVAKEFGVIDIDGRQPEPLTLESF